MTPNGLELNWSGYAVTAANVTSVSGTFTVPAVTGPGTVNGVPTDVSVWAGIDGYVSSTVEQTGVSGSFNSKTNTATYYAWWEMYPQDFHKVNSISVSAGDSMSASVSYSGGVYTLSLADNTNGQSFVKQVKASGPARSSAEWIVERASLNYKGGVIQPLATFSPITFTDEQYSTSGGAAQTLQQAWDAGSARGLVIYSYNGSIDVILDAVSAVSSNAYTVTFIANGLPYKL